MAATAQGRDIDRLGVVLLGNVGGAEFVLPAQVHLAGATALLAARHTAPVIRLFDFPR